MDDERCTIFELDIRKTTREWICQEATEKGCEAEEALDMIVREWKNYRVSGELLPSIPDSETHLFLDTTSLSDDIADKVVQRLKNEFVLTTE